MPTASLEAPSESLETISDDELHIAVRRLTARSNVALADLLAHLGEMESRGIYRVRACASLYTYCVYELRMSEDAAYRRSKAARLVRRYPDLHGVIARGEIHLTGLLMVGPYLGGERHAEVLERARFRTKRELLGLVAELDPKSPVPASSPSRSLLDFAPPRGRSTSRHSLVRCSACPWGSSHKIGWRRNPQISPMPNGRWRAHVMRQTTRVRCARFVTRCSSRPSRSSWIY